MTEHGRQAALVEGARAGEPEAIADLYEMFGATVYRVALRLMNSAADAEDVVQDVFVGLGRSLLASRDAEVWRAGSSVSRREPR